MGMEFYREAEIDGFWDKDTLAVMAEFGMEPDEGGGD